METPPPNGDRLPPIAPPPARPELPEGVTPTAGPPYWTPPSAPAPEPGPRWPAFPWWAPLPALAIAFVVAMVVFVVSAGLADAFGADVDLEDPPTGIIVVGTMAQDFGLIVFAFVFAAMGGSRPTLEMFGFRQTRLWAAIGWTALTFISFYVFSFIWALVVGIEESDDLAVELGAKDSTLNLVVIALLVTVIAPITEEFFFRGFCFPAFARKIGVAGAAIAVGVIFGAIHIGSAKLEFIPPLMIFGALLCLLAWRTDSLLPCIALHAVNNALALGVSLGWEWWEVVIAAVTAPAIVMLISIPISRPRSPAPA